MARRSALPPLACALVLLTGCAGWARSYDLAPSGLARTEEELRRALAAGQADSALVQRTLVGETSPGDELLRALYGGITAYHAGRYRESAALLDVAAALADDRATKSISRSAFALLTNDYALPYEPSRSERLLIPFYGALAYLRLNDLEGAAVEARRLGALLQQYQDDVSPDERPLHDVLRYFAGAVFEAWGDRNDAAVSYRNVHSPRFAPGIAQSNAAPAVSPGTSAATSAAGPPAIPADSGDVVLVLAHGFVAHRVEQSLNVLLAPDELDYLRVGDPDRRFGYGHRLAERVLAHASPDGQLRERPVFIPLPDSIAAELRENPADAVPHAPDTAPDERTRNTPSITDLLRPRSDSGRAVEAAAARGRSRSRSDRDRDRHSDHDDVDDDAPYLLRVAWPAYRRTTGLPIGTRVLDAMGDTAAHVVFADVSAAVLQDFQRELPLIVARTLVRGAARAAITKGAENRLEKKNESLGKLIGILGNVGNVLLERADTRSWHLLPGAIGIARLRLPAGVHDLRIELPSGTAPELPAVRVSGGRATVVSARAW